MSPFDVFHSFYARPGHSAASATDSSNASNSTHEALSPYFLGPQGENADQLVRLLAKLVHDQVATRKNYHPEDGVSVLYPSPPVCVAFVFSVRLTTFFDADF